MKLSRNYILTLLAGLSVTLFFSCQENSSTSDQASILTRGGQAVHLDRFEHEIQAFEQADKQKMPPKNAVLFAGGSSIRLWSSLENDFAPLPVINRGFGGSTIPEVMFYADRIVWKYEPKVIVYYCGENDIAEQTPPAVVFQNFKKYIGETEKRLPNTTLVFISLKPSPQRWNLWRDIQQVNTMVEQFAKGREHLRFVDIGPTLLAADGKPDPSLFVEDKLHLNGEGYQRWVEVLKPIVSELYEGKASQ